ncbi:MULTISPECIES: L-serine ammonia-lyase, iron-sulfur-dependent subunit beta [unclassified Breznakia]|uniref:L-serine ammonia-lyase, iron-sulfur-dependent subunit beta n=1 Tax=unclassified Breznakia TaxID=2623764 RepID=UPI0024761DCE|nr:MULTISPECIES: L-serine ammonia-lyase, iron-sulfur-dependent subunit beta [unclassified Breznakia]MDH6366480.1 L-serine dehydratase [Breznakia sp. PH1-1]MDH6403573.1 L-serine dehydratase [Breznakia sp. PF1-11]MDH6411282.1 L-serine dehydratase [Breznakia sp. PFB1-11]MDH6413742.1 L-serine dehydratase [Breznakia sp. PFB1-14]MDH6415827.1 L-serine dehydratase [Breznakia sp. PFB1-4]
MKEISMFDVIGPNMIGPSSSHTAGACRIAQIARRIANEKIVDVRFDLYGSFAKTYKGHGTDRALVAGMLGMNPDDERIKDSFSCAKEAGLAFTFKEKHDPAFAPNTVIIHMVDQFGVEYKMRGESVGGGEVMINSINGVEVNLSGEYDTIVVKQQDAPGVIARLSSILAKYGINIAFMKLYREDKGKIAYTIVEVDEYFDNALFEELRKDQAILSVSYIARLEWD